MQGVTGEDGERGGDDSLWLVRGGVIARAGTEADARGDRPAGGAVVFLGARRLRPDCMGTYSPCPGSTSSWAKAAPV